MSEIIKIKTPMADAYKQNRPDIYYGYINNKLHENIYNGELSTEFKLAKNLALLNTGKNFHNKDFDFIQQIINKDANFTYNEIGVIISCMQNFGYELFKQIENIDTNNYGALCLKVDELGKLFDFEYMKAHQDFEVHLKLSGGKVKIMGTS